MSRATIGRMSAQDSESSENGNPSTPPSAARDLIWRPDILGPGYEQADLDMGADPDTGSDVRAVLVRASAANRNTDPNKPALLWLHGLSDYFFQTHVADYFTSRGYAFYALDLRRCGRARQRGQRWHYTSDLAHYFPEMTAALASLTTQHDSVVMLAHSTGGLIAPLWADHLRTEDPVTHAALRGLILNSPWLDLQYPGPLVKVMKPVVKFAGRIVPLLPLPQGAVGTYGASIHESAHGEWKFDTTMKPLNGHRKYLGWLRAIINAQERIHDGAVDAGVPVLTLVSSHSYLGEDYTPAADTADTVLDVDQIRKWAPRLSRDSTVRTIDGARHDVFLSERFARELAGKASIEWLESLPTKEAHT